MTTILLSLRPWYAKWLKIWDLRIGSGPEFVPHRPWTTLVQVKACNAVSANPLPEPMLTSYQLDPFEQTLNKNLNKNTNIFNLNKYLNKKYKYFHTRTCFWKCCLQNICHLVRASLCWIRNFLIDFWHGCTIKYYHRTSNISHALVGNKIVDHSDVVGASPVGAAPTTSSF